MYLENEKCRIWITVDESYTIDSSDNPYYDVVLNPGEYKKSDHYKVLRVQIELPAQRMLLALIGSYYSCAEDCAVLEDEILTILLNDHILQLNVSDGTVTRFIDLDYFGCCLAIYRVDAGYLIHGEIEITMMDLEFHKKWVFSGRDIFVSVSGKQSLKICGGLIYLCDFEDNEYVLDFNGKLRE